MSTVEAKRRSTVKTQKLCQKLDLMKSLSPDCGASGHSSKESGICMYEQCMYVHIHVCIIYHEIYTYTDTHTQT